MSYKLADGSVSTDYQVGDTFEVVEKSDYDAHRVGSIISLYKGCYTRSPLFTTVDGDCNYNNADGESGCYENWYRLKPTPETIEKVKQRKGEASMKTSEQQLKELGETIAQAQKQYHELQSQVEAEAKKSVHISELLKGGKFFVSAVSNYLKGVSNARYRKAGAEFQTQEHSKEAATKRLQRNQLEAWVYQEMEDGEVCDNAVWFNSKGVLMGTHNATKYVGAVIMPIRLAKLLCEKVNSGEWTL